MRVVCPDSRVVVPEPLLVRNVLVELGLDVLALAQTVQVRLAFHDESIQYVL